MRPNPFDLKELHRMDVRLRAYKERSWDEHGHPEHPLNLAVSIITLGALIAFSILNLFLWIAA
jgi:hypothetical protein